MEAAGSRAYAEVYGAVLQAIAPGADCLAVHPCEDDPVAIMGRIDPAAIDGVVWTGSSLNVYKADPEVTAQVALFERLFATGAPIFGSCWGLQVMATALGGKVRRNPYGREVGIARDVTLNAAGAAHPMYAGKPPRFDSIAAHIDEVEILPRGSVVLAGNEASAIQAAVLEEDGRSFWGVQYHPEFDLQVLAQSMRRGGDELIAEGFLATRAEVEAVCVNLERIGADPQAHRATRGLFGVSESVANDDMRRREIANWIETVARPRAAMRAGGL
jgi:GMP synthase (glutamine-hydrolysing)